LWWQVEDKSPATRSRWQWTWIGDDSDFTKYGRQLGLVGTWWSGQVHRVCLGIDGLLWVVVIGEGKLVITVDVEVRCPHPVGLGGHCRDKLTWLQVMLDRTWRARQRRCWRLPPPLVIAAPGLGFQVARPGSRIAWRSKQALRRTWAVWSSWLASSRVRARSRLASSATVGTSTRVRSSERLRRARWTASRRSVFARSPAWWV
jgi:hypothetical protein